MFLFWHSRYISLLVKLCFSIYNLLLGISREIWEIHWGFFLIKWMPCCIIFIALGFFWYIHAFLTQNSLKGQYTYVVIVLNLQMHIWNYWFSLKENIFYISVNHKIWSGNGQWHSSVCHFIYSCKEFGKG